MMAGVQALDRMYNRQAGASLTARDVFVEASKRLTVSQVDQLSGTPVVLLPDGLIH